jgi:hypothetical protein
MTAATVLSLLTSGAANAQVPSYAQQPESVTASDDLQIRGRIVNFDGEYGITVRDERGFLDAVRMHPGTIINPTGLTLTPGMIVSVIGYNVGPYVDANEVDTPYMYEGSIPYYGGHPWNYYGPGVGLGFFFGNHGWWHGDYFRGGFNYNGGARAYHDGHINNIYHVGGGSYHGRAYAAPRERGGYYGRSGGGHDGRGGRDRGGRDDRAGQDGRGAHNDNGAQGDAAAHDRGAGGMRRTQ